MEKVKWFDRKFDFDFTVNGFPLILKRFSQAPSKFGEKCKSIPPEITTVRLDNTWSIKENIGHLIDLEPLWQGRFEDILNGEEELRPTDLQNTKTDLANHNERSITDLLNSFRDLRIKTIQQIESIDEETIYKSALHPRLKTPMRTIDLFHFVAEHDDHHFARITEIEETIQAAEQ